MKLFVIFISIFLLHLPAEALELFGSNSYQTKEAALQKYLDFVKKDGRCDFAVAVVPRTSSTKILKSIYDRFPSILRCIGDLTFNMDTINETFGCTAFYLDPTNKMMSSLLPPEKGGDYNMVKGKKCLDAFDELVKMPTGTFVRLPVGKTLSGDTGFGGTPLFGGRGSGFEEEAFLIYSTNQKYTDWYFAEKKRMEEETKQAYAKAKKKGELNTYANGEKVKAPVTDEKIP